MKAEAKPPGGLAIFGTTLWTIVEQPDFKIFGAVQEHAAVPHASARPYVAASAVASTAV